MITITRFASLTHVTGTLCDLSSWRAFLSAPVIGEQKKGLPGWSPAHFTNNRRGQPVRSVVALVLDHDDGAPLEQIEQTWNDTWALVHPSFSSSAECPKHRLILPFDRAVDAAEYSVLWAWAQKRDPGIDAKARDASRFWFVPARRPGAPYYWRELAGAVVEVEPILREHRPLPPAPPPRCSFRSGAGHSVVDRARAYLARVPGAVSGQGGHSTTFRAARALVVGFALEPSIALELLREWNRTCDPPWSERELVHKVKSAETTPSNRPRGFLLGRQAA